MNSTGREPCQATYYATREDAEKENWILTEHYAICLIPENI